MRKSTKDKERKVLSIFHRLLRSGKDYSVDGMYSEAAKKCFLEPGSAGNIIRKYYKKVISPEMKQFASGFNCTRHNENIELFAKEFNLCKRESRLIVRYIKVGKNRNK